MLYISEEGKRERKVYTMLFKKPAWRLKEQVQGDDKRYKVETFILKFCPESQKIDKRIIIFLTQKGGQTQNLSS